MRFTAVALVGVALLGTSPPSQTRVIERSGSDLIAYRLCNLPGFQACSTLQTELENSASLQVDRVIEQAYQGASATSVALPGGRTLTLSAIRMRTPVCNPLGEDQTNRLGQSCGTTCQITCQTLANSRIQCGMPDYASCGRERAWVRGAYVQMVKNKFKHVRDEVRSQNQLRLSADCEAPLGYNGYATASAAYSQISQELASRTGSATPSCQGLGDRASDAPQSELLPCYLSAVRRALELVLGEAMVCESLHRADQLWWTERLVLNELTRNRINQIVADGTCRPHYGNVANLQTCLNQEYNTQILGSFTAAMQGYRDAN